VKKAVAVSLFSILAHGHVSAEEPSPKMSWLNEPKAWTASGNRITMTAEAKTDFWRVTHYGYITDNGHFYFVERDGDFTATVKVQGQYAALYDQAGLMVRIDEQHWIKTGIEWVNGTELVSTVVTRAVSDWSGVR
jgi:uncharacterized protein